MMLPRCEVGRNSAKMAPSTGILPPTPKPRQKRRSNVHSYDCMNAVIIPVIPPMVRVRVNGNLRPTTSDVRPQVNEPMHIPENKVAANHPKYALSTSHWFCIGVMINVIASDHMESAM